jgi:hypothetical protein
MYTQIPEFFQKNGYKDMIDIQRNATIEMHSSNLFENVAKSPKREAVFASAMKIQDLMPPSTHPQFQFSES